MKKLILIVVFGLVSSVVLAGTNYTSGVQSSILKLKQTQSDSVMSDVLFHSMTDFVFPSWMGTKWDFNGISNIPGQGMIACGYFVSTTLKHIGFNLNRYKLAQQGATEVINALCGTAKMRSVLEADIINKLKERGNNRLYVVGLDYHVGFLAVENNEVYFIHSDYYHGKVVREKAADSVSFAGTNAYVYGEVTNNPILLKKWKNGTKVY